MLVIRKLIGLLLLLAAIIGLLFSILGISFLWRFEERLTTSIQSTVDLLGQTLQTTSQGLEVTNTALAGSVATIQSLQTTVQTTAYTVKSSTPMVEEIGILMDEDLPKTIEATANSLRSAAESAKVIDSLLSTISSLPLIGASLNYSPDIPLSESLGDVADSLGSLPGAFENIKANLQVTTSNLETFETDLTMMAESIGEIETSVAQYDQVIAGYQKSLDQIQLQLDVLINNAPTIIRYLLLALTVFLAWMAIANLGLLTQGWELLTEKREKEEEAQPAPEKTD